jgi:hypothetical protein
MRRRSGGAASRGRSGRPDGLVIGAVKNARVVDPLDLVHVARIADDGGTKNCRALVNTSCKRRRLRSFARSRFVNNNGLGALASALSNKARKRPCKKREKPALVEVRYHRLLVHYNGTILWHRYYLARGGGQPQAGVTCRSPSPEREKLRLQPASPCGPSRQASAPASPCASPSSWPAA